MAGRPIILSIVALLVGIIGIITTASAAYGLLDAVNADTVMALIVGLIYIVTAYGLWKGIKLFWYIGVIVGIVNVILGIYRVFTADAWDAIVSIVLNLIVLWYLFTSKVKKHFDL